MKETNNINTTKKAMEHRKTEEKNEETDVLLKQYKKQN